MNMNILHIVHSNVYSGLENVVIQIMRYYQGTDYHMTYCTFDGPIVDVLKGYGLPYVTFSKFSYLGIRRIVHDLSIDFIHAHDFRASIMASFLRVPYISHIHCNPAWANHVNLNSISYYLTSAHAGRILSVSDAFINEYCFSKRLKPQIEIVGNPIDVHGIRGCVENIEHQNIDIIVVGRLAEPKNPIRALKILRKALKRFPQASVEIIGDGDLRDEVREFIDSNGMNDKVKMLGHIHKPYAHIANAKCLLMPSKCEGFGLVAVEALALGVPVVCTPVGGLPGIVDSSCGLLSDDDDELADEICKLISDDDYRRMKAGNALQRADELDNLDDYMMRMRRIYDEVYRCS